MALRGRPKTGRPRKRVVAIRLSPELFDEAKRFNPNLSQAVEQALTAWIKRERRKGNTGADRAAPLPPSEPRRTQQRVS